jgi:hypothetical protein
LIAREDKNASAFGRGVLHTAMIVEAAAFSGAAS